MRKKTLLKYCIFILLFTLILFIKEYTIEKLDYMYMRTFGTAFSYICLITIPFVLNIIIGLLFGLDRLTAERKKSGKWKIDIPRIIILGLPSLFFSLSYYIALLNIEIFTLILYGTDYIPIFQILLGYVLITCLYKDSSELE
ncbi:MAG: hypothetical protein GX379_01690 [Clostridiales bacterium]|nr:hypothetical protein [Clostridiales bacterium]